MLLPDIWVCLFDGLLCLQVIIACLYYNTDMTWQVMQTLTIDPNQPIIDKFVRMWLYDTDCFLGFVKITGQRSAKSHSRRQKLVYSSTHYPVFSIHDRKLCLIGLTILMTCANKPTLLAEKEVSDQILPACLMLFDGLTRAYQGPFSSNKRRECHVFFQQLLLSL